MKKFFNILVVFVFCFLTVGVESEVFAIECGFSVNGLGIQVDEWPETKSLTFTVDLSQNVSIEKKHKIILSGGKILQGTSSIWFSIAGNKNDQCNHDNNVCVSVNNKIATFTITDVLAFRNHVIKNRNIRGVYLATGNSGNQCLLGIFTVKEVNPTSDEACEIKQITQTRNGVTCYQNQSKNACFENKKEVTLSVSNLKDSKGALFNDNIRLKTKEVGAGKGEFDGQPTDAINGEAFVSFKPDAKGTPADYILTVVETKGINEPFNCSTTLRIQNGCSADQCTGGGDAGSFGGKLEIEELASFSLCEQIPDGPQFSAQREDCHICTEGSNKKEGGKGVWTALGCIKRDPQSIMQKLIKVGVGISGGVALITFLASGFIFSTSQGDPKAYGKAKEMMTSAIVGLLFIIFSVTVLQFVGYEILKIPGFGGV